MQKRYRRRPWNFVRTYTSRRTLCIRTPAMRGIEDYLTARFNTSSTRLTRSLKHQVGSSRASSASGAERPHEQVDHPYGRMVEHGRLADPSPGVTTIHCLRSYDFVTRRLGRQPEHLGDVHPMLHKSSKRPHGHASGRRSASAGRFFRGPDGLVHLRALPYTAGIDYILLVCERGNAPFSQAYGDVTAIPERLAAQTYATCVRCLAMDRHNA